MNPTRYSTSAGTTEDICGVQPAAGGTRAGDIAHRAHREVGDRTLKGFRADIGRFTQSLRQQTMRHRTHCPAHHGTDTNLKHLPQINTAANPFLDLVLLDGQILNHRDTRSRHRPHRGIL